MGRDTHDLFYSHFICAKRQEVPIINLYGSWSVCSYFNTFILVIRNVANGVNGRLQLYRIATWLKMCIGGLAGMFLAPSTLQPCHLHQII